MSPRRTVSPRALVVEALAAARATPLISLVVVVMVAGMCAAIAVTNGRAVAAERAVIASIDSAGTRSIVVSARPGTGLDSTIADRAASISDIEWIGTVRFISDARNERIPGGDTTPVQSLWASSWNELGLPKPTIHRSRQAYATSSVLDRLGIADGIGRIELDDHSRVALAGPVALPDRLVALRSSAILTEEATKRSDTVDKVLIVVRSADRVGVVARAVAGVLSPADLANATISTSKQLALVRHAVKGELGNASRALAMLITAVTALLACAILVLSVMQRRKEFGRRRALGASRSLVVAIVLIQCGALATLGAAAGITVAVAALLLVGSDIPSADYLAAIGVLAVCVTLVASMPPAYLASRRDPVRELRVP